MKIGMITFHNVMNLGANLQAYALNKYINTNIGQCEIIDFYPNNQTAHKNRLRRFLSKVKAVVFYRSHTKKRKYAKFQKKFYVKSARTYYGDSQIQLLPPRYDVLISGSDQILNTTLSGESTSYYLNFDNEGYKISYASSFGREKLSGFEYSLIDTELTKFKYLSVREKSAAKIIEERIGRSPKIVLDPVFLLTEEEWKQIGSNIKLPDKYIFVYAMEVTESIKKAVENVKKKYDIPVLIVYGSIDNMALEGKVILDCGPEDLITYIRNASIVVTNSFHGTAFSIIFRKKLLCIAHSMRNTRLDNMMELISQKELLISCTTDGYDIKDYIVDGYKAFVQLEKYIRESKEYLNLACNYQGDEAEG